MDEVSRPSPCFVGDNAKWPSSYPGNASIDLCDKRSNRAFGFVGWRVGDCWRGDWFSCNARPGLDRGAAGKGSWICKALAGVLVAVWQDVRASGHKPCADSWDVY